MNRQAKTLVLGFLFSTLVIHVGLGQQITTETPPRVLDFNITDTNEGDQFSPILPPLQQRAGAPPAFWDFFWQFGDGYYSRDEAPIHQYDFSGEYDIYLLATGNYDTGSKPDKKKKKRSALAYTGGENRVPNYAFKDDIDLIGIEAARDPSPGEENIMVISYRNNRTYPVKGKIHLHFNERSFPQPHFQFEASHLHHGEVETPQVLTQLYFPGLHYPSFLYAFSQNQFVLHLPAPLGLAENNRDQVMAEADQTYRDHWSCSFIELQPNEQRNLFLSIRATPEMVKDTAVKIHLQAAMETEGGELFAFDILEIPIVAAHDPNVQQVSDRKTGFRNIRKKKLEYKTRFQNTGEGPAETIKIETSFRPEGVLDLEDLEILGMYPEVPLCPTDGEATFSCLDTAATKDKLIFTFKNVYLPGKKQADLEDKDATKGFVNYAIKPSKKMKRRSFRTRAAIFFDKEKPVFTNRAKTRFKFFEPSLMPIFGYRFESTEVTPASLFFGLEVASTYKASGFYLQAGINSGLSGDQDFNFALPTEERKLAPVLGPMREVIEDSLSISGTFSGTRRYNTLEFPVQVRRNLNNFLGVGLGLVYVLTFEKSEVREVRITERFSRICFENENLEPCRFFTDWTASEPVEEISGNSIKDTFGKFQLFADFNIGSVLAGPSLGLRSYLDLGKGPNFQQVVYVAWRF